MIVVRTKAKRFLNRRIRVWEYDRRVDHLKIFARKRELGFRVFVPDGVKNSYHPPIRTSEPSNGTLRLFNAELVHP